MTEQPTLEEAMADLRKTFLAAISPSVLPILRWMDRQLRRWPRLYARLSR